jgi:hypothetical protein
VIIWLAPIQRFRAYARLPGTRRDLTLTADTPDHLAAGITQAEQAAHVKERR